MGGTFVYRRGRKVQRQADGENVPNLPHLGLICMQFRANDGGEIRRAESACIGDRPVVPFQEMVGQRHKVITGLPVALTDRLHRIRAIRVRAMCV